MVMTRMARFGLTVENFDNETSLFKSLRWICAHSTAQKNQLNRLPFYSPLLWVCTSLEADFGEAGSWEQISEGGSPCHFYSKF